MNFSPTNYDKRVDFSNIKGEARALQVHRATKPLRLIRYEQEKKFRKNTRGHTQDIPCIMQMLLQLGHCHYYIKLSGAILLSNEALAKWSKHTIMSHHRASHYPDLIFTLAEVQLVPLTMAVVFFPRYSSFLPSFQN